MDMTTIMPWIMLAVGGALGGNILGLITRGGGGLIGRTIFGAIGGAAAGYAAQNFPAIGDVASAWANLLPDNPELSGRLSGLITGAAGGGVLGLITGLLIRSRS